MHTCDLCVQQRVGKQLFDYSAGSVGGILYTAAIPSSAFEAGDLVRWLVQVSCLATKLWCLQCPAKCKQRNRGSACVACALLVNCAKSYSLFKFFHYNCSKSKE